MANPELIVKIVGDAKKFKKELDQVEKNVDEANARMVKKAKLAAAAVAAAVVAGGIASFKAFADFERDFSNVVTLLDKTSFKTKSLAQGINDLKGGLKALAASSGESFENLNKGLFDLISAGVDAEKAMGALKVATDLALAGGTDTAVAVDGLTSALNAYNLEADQAQEVAEKFFTAQKFGKTTIEELSNSFGQVGATAASLNVSLDEVLASVSAVTTAGIGTNEAYTGLKAVFANVIKPTKDAAEEAKRLGIDFSAASLRAQGLAGFLDSVTSSANFNKDSLGKLFGSVEALNAVTALAGNQSDEFRETLDALGDEAGSAATFTDALAVKTNTADQAMRRAKGSIAAAAVTIGQYITPEILTFTADLTDGINENQESVELLGKTLAKVLQILKLAIDVFAGVANILTSRVAGAFARVNARILQASAAIDDLRGKDAEADGKRAVATEILSQADLQEGKARNDTLDAIGGDLSKIFEQDIDLGILKDKDVEVALERQRELEEGKREIKDEALEADREARIEAEEENREEGLTDPIEEQTDEEFEETREKNVERLEGIADDKADDRRKEIAAAKKAAQEREKIEREKAEKLKKIDDEMTKAFITNLKTVFDEQTAVGKAIFLFEKAQAIAQTIMNTREAMTLAIATLPPPAGEAKAAQYAAFGAVQVATIAAQAIQGISAQQGGIVAGVGSGDKVPALLEAGEIVVPRKFNPLSPNFEETFGGGLNLGGNQKVVVDLNLDENASKILTAQQREDRTLGVSR